jgi:hypothetical protein
MGRPALDLVLSVEGDGEKVGAGTDSLVAFHLHDSGESVLAARSGKLACLLFDNGLGIAAWIEFASRLTAPVIREELNRPRHRRSSLANRP